MSNPEKYSERTVDSATAELLVEIDAVQRMIAYLIPQVADLSASAAAHLDLAQDDIDRVRSSMNAATALRMN